MQNTSGTIIGKEYSFWKLIDEYEIQIPMIQRDYAQGRKSKLATNVREAFIDNIYNAITQNTVLELDFIYASITKDNKLEPIDGQQRLTTLFLLHWYFANKDKVATSAFETLKKFSYVTRVSSTTFCSKLCDYQNIDFSTFDKISENIENTSWFIFSWKHDPTVTSMLTMLDKIHEKFEDIDNPVFELLVGGGSPLVFQFLKITEFDDTEDLYIKMNARGKRLTDYENFKGQFGKYINENASEEIQQLFWNNIDSKWSNDFWNYIRNKQGENWDYTIDNQSLQFLWFQIEILYLINNNNNVEKTDTASIFYEKESQNILFNNDNIRYAIISERTIGCLNSIDFLVCSLKNFEFFDEIVLDVLNNVTLWDEKKNLFSSSMSDANDKSKNEFDYFSKIILFFIISWCNVNGGKPILAEEKQNLYDFIRICRNFFQRYRIVRKDQLGTYNIQLKFKEIGRPIRFLIDTFITNITCNPYQILNTLSDEDCQYFKKYINEEKVKSNLMLNNKISSSDLKKFEDNPHIRGTLNNFISNDTFILSHEEVSKLWCAETLDNNLIWRAIMATSKEFKIKFSDGKIRFGGRTTAQILVCLTLNDNTIKSSFIDFSIKFRNYTSKYPDLSYSQILQLMIKDYLENNSPFLSNVEQFSYYIIKYPILTAEQKVFQFSNDHPFETRQIEKYTLKSKHINALSIIIIKDEILSSYFNNNSWVKGYEYPPLESTDGLIIECRDDAWHIKSRTDKSLNNIIKATETQDRIETLKSYLLTHFGINN